MTGIRLEKKTRRIGTKAFIFFCQKHANLFNLQSNVELREDIIHVNCRFGAWRVSKLGTGEIGKYQLTLQAVNQ